MHEPQSPPSSPDSVTAVAAERLPKVELHCHLEGTMRPQTLVELAAKNGLALPLPASPQEADLRQLYTYVSLNDFLQIREKYLLYR